ncbi:repressed By RIM101 protein 2 [[Candida] anglica]|uniref:Repressed By RIM101 protein 2 n=1 Tax=[Candida] anglica TaxID=148631 RepID=A0ABP0EH39_9ASCO
MTNFNKTLLLILNLITLIYAMDSSDAAFITRLVDDVKSNVNDYVQFYLTATVSVPKQFTQVALQLQSYTGSDYASVVESDDINVTSLESFATNLPWYSSRLAVNDVSAATTTGDGTSGSATATQTSSSSKSTNGAASPTNDMAGGIAAIAAVAAAAAAVAII